MRCIATKRDAFGAIIIKVEKQKNRRSDFILRLFSVINYEGEVMKNSFISDAANRAVQSELS